jgi:hypothetical protein
MWGTWAYDYQVAGQYSYGGAALGCLNGTRTIMVHNGLQWLEFGPDARRMIAMS